MPKTAKRKYRRGRRICIFCGKEGKISKEHIFALWLREFFPRDAKTKHKSAFISWPDKIGTQNAIDKRKLNQGHVGSKQLRVVCDKCNNGWLSDMESTAQQVLPPLIIGGRCNILPGGQRFLSTWAAKTAMVVEHSKPTDSGITQAERTWLMKNLTPQEKWFVWISAYNGKEWGNLGISQIRVGLNPTPVAKPSDTAYYGQATTFGVGHIVFCVVSTSSPDIPQRLAGREADGLVQICPPQARSILWPPGRIFGDKEVYSLANIFALSGIFDNTFDPGANWTFTH